MDLAGGKGGRRLLHLAAAHHLAAEKSHLAGKKNFTTARAGGKGKKRASHPFPRVLCSQNRFLPNEFEVGGKSFPGSCRYGNFRGKKEEKGSFRGAPKMEPFLTCQSRGEKKKKKKKKKKGHQHLAGAFSPGPRGGANFFFPKGGGGGGTGAPLSPPSLGGHFDGRVAHRAAKRRGKKKGGKRERGESSMGSAGGTPWPHFRSGSHYDRERVWKGEKKGKRWLMRGA